MVMAANADKKLGKYGRSNLWSRSENSVSAMGTMGTMSDSKMLKSRLRHVFDFVMHVQWGPLPPLSRRATQIVNFSLF